jgi:diguanylate cyclase (GGDEF)-like protein
MSESVASEVCIVEGEVALSPLGRADRHQWWLSSSALSVASLLAIGIASFALPAVSTVPDASYVLLLAHAAAGLLSLVCLFNIYIIYKQVQINRVRRAFTTNLYEMAVLDPTTKMFNRRYATNRLEAEIARCNRHASPLTIITFDLDCFKEINDKYGHATGDYVLRTFGEQLKKATRGSDIAARYGGDEFIAILPDCTAQQVQHVLQRMNDIHVRTVHSKIEIRYSAGWADYIRDESLADLLKRADDMLYANKRNPQKLFVNATCYCNWQVGAEPAAHR